MWSRLGTPSRVLVVGGGAAASYFVLRSLFKKPPVQFREKLVILGGGYAGARTASLLQKNFRDLVIVDPKDVFYHNIGGPRALVQPGFLAKMTKPYADVFGDQHIRSKAVGVNTTDQSVTLESGENLQYDVLVLALGSTGAFPAKYAGTDSHDVRKKFNVLHRQLKTATNVVIVGGGAVGCEIAGEIKSEYGEKKNVTVVHGSDKWLVQPNLSEEFQKQLKSKMNKLGIQLHLGAKVTNIDDLKGSPDYPVEVQTSDGKAHPADLVFLCTGIRPNTSDLEGSLGEYMDEQGHFKVEKNLQVSNLKNVYAIGDCTALDTKLAMKAQAQANYVADNICHQLSNEPLKDYQPGPAPVLPLPLGPKIGVSEFANFMGVKGDFVTKKIKGESMMTFLVGSCMSGKPPPPKGEKSK